MRWRRALADAGLELQRVGTKAAHDYAEVFDEVCPANTMAKMQRSWPSWRR